VGTLDARNHCRWHCCRHLETAGVRLVFPERICPEAEGDESSDLVQLGSESDEGASIQSNSPRQFCCCYAIACDLGSPVMAFQQEGEA
jgi:hypothetical protein